MTLPATQATDTATTPSIETPVTTEPHLQATEKTIEAKPQEPTPAPAPTPAVSEDTKKFSALVKRDRELYQREQALKERERKISEHEEWTKKLEQDPLAALEARGLSFSKLVDAQLGKGQPLTVEKQLEELRQKYEDLVNERKTEKKQTEEQQLDNAISAFKDEIRESVESQKEQYPIVHTENQIDEVYNLIVEYHKETGKYIDPLEAAKLLEDHLYEERSKLLAIDKFKKALTPATEPEPVIQKPNNNKIATPEKRSNGPTESDGQKSLTNDLQSIAPVRTDRRLTREERLAKAATLLQWRSAD